MLQTPAFTWYTGCPKRSFLQEHLPGLWTLPFILSPRYFYHPPAGPWRRKRHFEATNVPIPANEDVFKAGDLLRCFIEAAPVLQAILTVSEVTSGAALTGIADLEAAPEVTQTKPF